MEYLIFSVYDRVAGTYSEPFYHQRIELAVRRFNFVMSSTPMISQDCDLFQLGVFDVEHGTLVPLEKPLFICRYEGARNG